MIFLKILINYGNIMECESSLTRIALIMINNILFKNIL